MSSQTPKVHSQAVQEYWKHTRDQLCRELRERMVGDRQVRGRLRLDTLLAYCDEMGIDPVDGNKDDLRRQIRDVHPTLTADGGGDRFEVAELKELLVWLDLGDELEMVSDVKRR